MANRYADADAKTAVEDTPLLSRKESPTTSTRKTCCKPITLILLCGFITSLSFGVTQVPLIYVFRVMTCYAYYDRHTTPPPSPPPPVSGGDRCALPEIEASTARAVALLGFSTTFFGVANLFLTGWGIKRFGVKSALALQVFWPAARLLVQNVGVMVGGATGIIIVQCSQGLTFIGGPNGYLLALNTYVTEVTEHKLRTGNLGRLAGTCMFGSSVGMLLGGLLAEAFGIITPFQVTLALFLVSTVYVLVCLPRIAPDKEAAERSPAGASRILRPMKTLLPARWMLQDGQVRWEYGALILAVGAYIGVLATGYIPTLLQMYATDMFGFGTKQNSLLVSMHSFLRGFFLFSIFPRIIAGGRKWMEKRAHGKQVASTLASTAPSGAATPTPQARLANAMSNEEEQDVMPPKLADEQETFDFDLIYTRFSLLVDGIVTLGASFVQRGSDMYIVGALLPFGAGTASAAKGTILQMCPSKDRVDALSAIAFVEMLARLSTTFVFGLVFAAFASMSKTYLTFTCNAAVALVGFVILLLSRFPPSGSRRLEETDGVQVEDSQQQT